MSVNKLRTVSQNMQQLEALLQWFESDDVTIELATKKYEEALILAKSIEEQLQKAKNQVEIIKKKFST